MHTNEAAIENSDGDSGQQAGWIRSLIMSCSDLPLQVREAEIARVDERLLDDSLFRILSEDKTADADDQAAQVRVQRRMQALSPYLGRKLICVSIRLPGVGYTIEIDPVDERIVHWEWQVA